MDNQEQQDILEQLSKEKVILQKQEAMFPNQSYEKDWTELAARYQAIDVIANTYYCRDRAKRYQQVRQLQLEVSDVPYPLLDPEINIPEPEVQPDPAEVDEELPGWQRAKNMGGI